MRNKKYTQEKRQSYLLDFKPMLSEGARRLMRYASDYPSFSINDIKPRVSEITYVLAAGLEKKPRD